MLDFRTSLNWEQTNREGIYIKHAYIDMVDGDLHAAAALSVIIYWHLPAKNGEPRLCIERDGYLWLAAKREEWWERARLTPHQIDRILPKLKKLGLIETALYKFDGAPTTHIRIDERVFMQKWAEVTGGFGQTPKSISGADPKSIYSDYNNDYSIGTASPPAGSEAGAPSEPVSHSSALRMPAGVGPIRDEVPDDEPDEPLHPLAEHLQATLVEGALQMALGRRTPDGDLLHHSDQGSQYTSTLVQTLLAELHIQVSMNGVGNCYDNTPMESFIGTLQTECADAPFATRAEARRAPFEYLEVWYNRQRLHSSLGYVSPAAFEQQYADEIKAVR